jgi:hypothetical protein
MLWIDYQKKPNYFTPEKIRESGGNALEISKERIDKWTR